MKQLTKIILILMSFLLLTCNDKITGSNNGNTDNKNNNGNNINNWNNNNNGNNDTSGDTGNNTPSEPTVYKYADFIGTNYYMQVIKNYGEYEHPVKVIIANKFANHLTFSYEYTKSPTMGIKETIYGTTEPDIKNIINKTNDSHILTFYDTMGMHTFIAEVDIKNKTFTVEKDTIIDGKGAKHRVTYSFYPEPKKTK